MWSVKNMPFTSRSSPKIVLWSKMKPSISRNLTVQRTQTARRSAEWRRCDDEKSEKTQKNFQKANNFATAKNWKIFENFFVFSLIFHRHIFAAQRSPVAKKGRYIRIGDKEVDYHPDFKLILMTKLSNPHYQPEMQAQWTLINFSVTRDGL